MVYATLLRLFRIMFGTDGTRQPDMPTCRTIFPAKVNDLKMGIFPAGSALSTMVR